MRTWLDDSECEGEDDCDEGGDKCGTSAVEKEIEKLGHGTGHM